MLFKKPNNLKFTDLCIFIDQNVPKIVNPGENPALENTIYNYLWLLEYFRAYGEGGAAGRDLCCF